ncbi:MAG: HNH endonuclease signature motif containing protein [Cyclobacteriaceae bacterium]
MIEKLPFILKLGDSETAILEAKKPWTGNQWKDKDFKDIVKPKILVQLKSNQECCAYCGLRFKGERDMQIEHIAPKAFNRRPQFTFTLKNLVLSCVYCNGLSVKGTTDTIRDPVQERYEDCDFLLVHPYFDDPDDHFDWTDEDDKIIIQVKNDSLKAQFSISMFDLTSSGMTEQRAGESFRRRRHISMPNTFEDEIIIQSIMNYKEQ